MPQQKPEPQPFRIAFPFLLALVLIGLWNLISAELASAAIPHPYIADQVSVDQFTRGDLGVAQNFVSDDTTVHTPKGDFIGPAGVQRYVHSLQREYPEAEFAVTDVLSAGGLIIVDWQGTLDGTVVIPGRTLITVEGGAIVEVSFLNLNHVSPSQGAPIVVEQPDAVFAVRAASIEAQGWPDFDPSGLADQVARVEAARAEAQTWPDFDPSSLPDANEADVLPGIHPGQPR